ncbi:MAG: hypothetical protein ABSC72_10660 [Methylovirgula sp.]|jgi:hypothetical protein
MIDLDNGGTPALEDQSGGAATNSAMVFCTSYIEDKDIWEGRYNRWLSHHKKVFPTSPLFIIDDGSPFLPDEEGVTISTNLSKITIGERATIFHFSNRLGRQSVTNFPGWFRSFTFSANIAKKFGFTKIIHIESDSFILTRKAVHYVETIDKGWTAFYCPRWNFPETAFQVICSDTFEALEKVRDTPYEENFSQKLMELSLPFTHVETKIYGNRYGEFRSKVPRSADFAIQVGKNVRYDSEFDRLPLTGPF